MIVRADSFKIAEILDCKRVVVHSIDSLYKSLSGWRIVVLISKFFMNIECPIHAQIFWANNL